jgi:hypothetical protein
MVHVMFQTTVLCTSNVELSVVLTISPLLEESNPLQYEAGVEVMFGSPLLTPILYKLVLVDQTEDPSQNAIEALANKLRLSPIGGFR